MCRILHCRVLYSRLANVERVVVDVDDGRWWRKCGAFHHHFSARSPAIDLSHLSHGTSMQPEVDATWKAGGTQDPWSSRLRLLEDSRKGQQIAKHCHNHGTLTNAPCTTHLCRFVTFY